MTSYMTSQKKHPVFGLGLRQIHKGHILCYVLVHFLLMLRGYRVFNIPIVRSMKQFIYFMIKGLPNSRIPRPVATTLKQITDLQYTQMEVIFLLICSFLPTGYSRLETRLPLEPTEQCTLL